jgi:hypothetical protein
VWAPRSIWGDLQAIHPLGSDRTSGAGCDHSLDRATITIDDHEHETLEAAAVEGIWGLALPEHLFCSAPYFASGIRRASAHLAAPAAARADDRHRSPLAALGPVTSLEVV